MTDIDRASCSGEAVAPTLAESGERGRERAEKERETERLSKGRGRKSLRFLCISSPHSSILSRQVALPPPPERRAARVSDGGR